MTAAAASLDTAKKSKARQTNDPTRLEGVSGNSNESRRFRDLVEQFLAPFGGADKATAPDVLLARNAALLQLQSDALEASIARGEPIDPNVTIRLSNVLQRALSALRRKGKAKPAPGGPDALAAILARHNGGAK